MLFKSLKATISRLCKEQLSDQYHYDFGLRALKYVLVSAGNIKRNQIHRAFNDAREKGEEVKQKDIAQRFPEHQILIQSICETLTPKLVSEDMTLLQSLLNDVFPDTSYAPMRHNEFAKFFQPNYQSYHYHDAVSAGHILVLSTYYTE